MATLYIMCGLPGAGKTTYAKRLEVEQGALRLTPDEWLTDLAIDGFDEGKRALVEALQWGVAERALVLGINVVIDWGVWGRSERDELREKARRVGASCEVCFLDVPLDELKSRLRRRNANLGQGEFAVEEGLLDEWDALFERPAADELPSAYVTTHVKDSRPI